MEKTLKDFIVLAEFFLGLWWWNSTNFNPKEATDKKKRFSWMEDNEIVSN